MTPRVPPRAALAASVVLCLGVSACATTTAGTATPAAQLPAATADTLPALLLSADDVGTALGAQVTVTKEVDGLWDDVITRRGLAGAGTDAGCVAIVGAASRSVYDGTDWTAARGRVLREPPTAPDWSRFASQSVVLFGSPTAAADFFSRSVRDWSGCAARDLTFGAVSNAELPAADQVWSIGPVAAEAGAVSVSRTQHGPMRWFCQRTLSVHGAVAVDVEACSADGPTTAAAAMARAIGERLPTP